MSFCVYDLWISRIRSFWPPACSGGHLLEECASLVF